MLELIEHSNLEIIWLMVLAFGTGFMACAVILWVPTQTKLDSLRRRVELAEYFK